MAQRWRAVVESVVNVVLTAAVLLSVVVIHKREVDGRSGLPKPRELQVNDWTGLRKSGQTIGTTSAPIQILVFADYQCPACRYHHYALRDLRLKLHDSVAFTYLHFPLPYHARALEAATGAECAAEQNTFESIQNALYSLQDSLAAMSMVRIASRAGAAGLVSALAGHLLPGDDPVPGVRPLRR